MKDKELSPAFQFYPKDYLGSDKVGEMSLLAEGAYIRLLSYQWLGGSIPADTSRMAKLCRISTPEMDAIWPELAPCFEPIPEDATRLRNPRLEIERQKQKEYRERQATNGRAGATKRHQPKPSDAMPPPVAPLTSSLSESEASTQPDGSFAVRSLQIADCEESASHSTGVREEPAESIATSPFFNAYDRLVAAALPGMLEPGEARISHALKHALDFGNLRFDGAPPPPKGKSKTISEAVESLRAWAQTRRWKQDHAPNLDTFLREARFLVEPPAPTLAAGTTPEHLDRARQLDKEMGLL